MLKGDELFLKSVIPHSRGVKQTSGPGTFVRTVSRPTFCGSVRRLELWRRTLPSSWEPCLSARVNRCLLIAAALGDRHERLSDLA